MANMKKYLKDDFPKIISIDVGAKYSFKSYEDITKWIDQEYEFYGKLGNPYNHQAQINSIKSLIDSLFNRNTHENFTFENLSSDIITQINRVYTSNKLISSKSKEGIWLAKQPIKTRHYSEGYLKYFIDKKQNGTPKSHFDKKIGELSAFIFDQDINPDIEIEKEKFNAFYDEIVKQKDALMNDILAQKQKNTNFLKKADEQNEEIIKRFDEEFSRHKKQMKQSEEFYEKKLAVKNAVTYWKNKARSHYLNSWIFGIIAAFLLIFSFYQITNIADYILNLDMNPDNKKAKRLLDENGALQLWVYGFFLVGVTLVIWFIRLIVKVFLSNLHLHSDAKERETMILTYLAFEREEKTLKPTDRDLILPSIFRVTTNGYIKEDSSPNSPINIIAKKFTD